MPVDHAIDVAADMAEVAAGDADVEVDGGEDVLVGDLGWDGAASELDEGAEQHRRRVAVVGRPLHATDDGGLPVRFNPAIMLALVDAGEGHVEQGLDRFDTCLRVLDADEVLVAVGVVDPEVGLVVLNARIEGADDALHDVFLG